jgi:hypothetical protein
VRLSCDLLFNVARCSSARANCELAACRRSAAPGSAAAALAEFPEWSEGRAAKDGEARKAQLKATTAKTGETWAKPLLKKMPADTLRASGKSSREFSA